MSDKHEADFQLDPITVEEPTNPSSEPMIPPIAPDSIPRAQPPKPSVTGATPKKPAGRFSVSWRDAFNTGIGQVDKDHRHLFSLINLLEVNTVNQVLDELLSYVAEHFQHEEELMRLSGYPDMADHIRQHEQLTNSVAKIVSTTVTWTPELIEQFRTFGLKWLVGHILNTDAKFGRWFRDNPIEYTMDPEGHYHKVQKSWWSRMLHR